MQKAQRDPAGGELLLAAIILVDRRGAAAGHRVSRLEVVEVEQFARDQPALDPPLIEIAEAVGVVRRRQHPLRGFVDLVDAAQILDAAEGIAGIMPAFCRYLLEQRFRLAGFVDDRDTCFGDRRLDRAEVACRAYAGIFVVDIEACVHSRFVVGGRDQAGEHVARLRFDVGRESVLAPGFVHGRLGAGLVAFAEQGARQREAPFGGARRIGSEKLDHRAPVGLLLPQRRFGAAAQRS